MLAAHEDSAAFSDDDGRLDLTGLGTIYIDMKKTSSPLLLVAILFAINAKAQQLPPPEAGERPANIIAAPPGQSLTLPSAAAPASVVSGYLRGRGASAATASSLKQVSQGRAGANGITHVRFEQQVGGLTVMGGYVKAAINAQGGLVHLIENVVAVPGEAPAAAQITEFDALMTALAAVHPGEQVAVDQAGVRNGNTTRFGGDAFFYSDPTVTRVAVPQPNGTLEVGFLVQTWSQKENLLHHTIVDGSGQVLSVELRTANDSYNIFAEDPLKGAQVLAQGPSAGSGQPSPDGWLGTGAQTTVNISGNNVNAYLDANANNAPDTGGTAVTDGNFLTEANLSASPTTTGNRAVAVQNLFYLNNIIHDVLYENGFTEAEGNFQRNNFAKGGLGNDPVLAEAQDGGGTDNANFATPADGSSPRMQMYLWTGLGTHEVVVGGNTFAAMGAQFGTALNTTGVNGPLAGAVDSGGTSNIDGCETITSAVSGKIAIIDRGTCDFTVKVLNAQKAGATAVIVVNNDDGAIFTMGGNQRKIKIPSVLVSKADGVIIRQAIGQNAILRKKPADPLQIDACLDADVVFHEFGHGLTWRMIGGMSGPISGAIGEGASDVVAFLVNGDDRIGEYSASSTLGIRRYPYDGYPLTYRSVTGGEVHNDGEIYAAILWDLSERYAGAALGVTDLLADFVDGMNYTPSKPTFENMRDGMLQAVAGTGRECLVWKAFAKFGVGVGSSAKIKGNRLTITESFAVQAGCE